MSDKLHTLTVRFENQSVADAGVLAAQLQDELLELRDGDPILQENLQTVELVKERPENMDFGATLVLLLGTPAAIAIAHGIARYLSRKDVTVEVDVTGADGGKQRAKLKHIGGKEAVKIIEALTNAPKSQK